METKITTENTAENMKEKTQETAIIIHNLQTIVKNMLITDIEVTDKILELDDMGSNLNIIIARASRIDYYKKNADKVTDFIKTIKNLNRKYIELFTSSDINYILHLNFLKQWQEDNTNNYYRYKMYTYKMYNVATTQDIPQDIPKAIIDNIGKMNPAGILTMFTEADKQINEQINNFKSKIASVQFSQKNMLDNFKKLDDMVKDLADEMSPTTTELTLKQIMKKLNGILSEKGQKQTDDIMADAVIAAISSSFTLAEVKNGESMGYESNFTNENGKLCGEVPEGGSEVAGEKCLNIIMQCLGEQNPEDCLQKWNKINLADGISFSNFHKPTAKKLAEHLGLQNTTTNQLVTDFNKSIDTYNNDHESDKNFTKREHINTSLKTALEALEKTLEKQVKPDTSTPTKREIRGNIPTRRLSIFAYGQPVLVHGGGSNKNNSSDIAISYANFIRNTHALKNMVSMTGGGFTQINHNTIRVIRKTWDELNKLMGDKGSNFSEKAKTSFLSDLDSLERSVRRIGIIAKYLEIVKEIFENNSFTAYLKDLKVDSKQMELSIVEKLVKKYNESSKAAEKKLGPVVATFGVSSADFATKMTAVEDKVDKKMTAVEDKVDKLTKTLIERISFPAERILGPKDLGTRDQQQPINSII
jgi:hypothetical protein